MADLIYGYSPDAYVPDLPVPTDTRKRYSPADLAALDADTARRLQIVADEQARRGKKRAPRLTVWGQKPREP